MANVKNILAFIALASLSTSLPESDCSCSITADIAATPLTASSGRGCCGMSITAEMVATSIASSCYTATTTVTAEPSNCPAQKCGPHALVESGPLAERCILEDVTTLVVPCANAECPTTPTVTVTASGSCPTCQKGCETAMATITSYDCEATSS